MAFAINHLALILVFFGCTNKTTLKNAKGNFDTLTVAITVEGHETNEPIKFQMDNQVIEVPYRKKEQFPKKVVDVPNIKIKNISHTNLTCSYTALEREDVNIANYIAHCIDKNNMKLYADTVGLPENSVYTMSIGSEEAVINTSDLVMVTNGLVDGESYDLQIKSQPRNAKCSSEQDRITFESQNVTIQVNCIPMYTLNVNITNMPKNAEIAISGLGDRTAVFTESGNQVIGWLPYELNDPYKVKLDSISENMNCEIKNNEGRITGQNTVIHVICKPLLSLQVMVTGLPENSAIKISYQDNQELELQKDGLHLVADQFFLPQSSYKVSLIESPSSQNCSLSNESGEFKDSDIVIFINCSDIYSLRAMVNGMPNDSTFKLMLEGASIEILANGVHDLAINAFRKGDLYNLSIADTSENIDCKIESTAGIFADNDILTPVNCVETFALKSVVSGLNGDNPLILELNESHKISISTNGTHSVTDSRFKKGEVFKLTIDTTPSGQSCQIHDNSQGLIDNQDIIFSITCTNAEFNVVNTNLEGEKFELMALNVNSVKRVEMLPADNSFCVLQKARFTGANNSSSANYCKIAKNINGKYELQVQNSRVSSNLGALCSASCLTWNQELGPSIQTREIEIISGATEETESTFCAISKFGPAGLEHISNFSYCETNQREDGIWLSKASYSNWFTDVDFEGCKTRCMKLPVGIYRSIAEDKTIDFGHNSSDFTEIAEDSDIKKHFCFLTNIKIKNQMLKVSGCNIEKHDNIWKLEKYGSIHSVKCSARCISWAPNKSK